MKLQVYNKTQNIVHPLKKFVYYTICVILKIQKEPSCNSTLV